MGASRSVCMRCGSFKRRALDTCATCGFAPSADDDIAKSMILSSAFDVGENTYGLADPDLEKAAALISDGRPYPFRADEIAQLAREYRAFTQTTRSTLIWSLVRWLGPPFLVLGLVWWLILRYGR